MVLLSDTANLFHLDIAFPLFDLLRCLVRWRSASEAIFSPQAWSAILAVSDLQRLLDEASSTSKATVEPPSNSASNCLLFVLRLLANGVAMDGARPDLATRMPASLPVIVKLVAKLGSLIEGGKVDILSNKKNHQVSAPATLRSLHTCVLLKHSREGGAGFAGIHASPVEVFIQSVHHHWV